MGQSLPGRIVFMGTPDFAAASLEALVRSRANVVAVFTQPDKPVGRRRTLTSPPVKLLAESAGIPVFQPRSLKGEEVEGEVSKLRPGVIVVAAYGKILPKSILAIPPMGCVNVHASLLPRHRGASPIAHSIWAGDSETGITIMKMDEGMDTGPVLMKRAIPMPAGATTESLTPALAGLGADLLLAALSGLHAGILDPQPQEDADATYAPRLKAEDGRLDFGRPSESLERQVRAFQPWPGTYFVLQGSKIKVLEATVGERFGRTAEAGRILPGPDFLGVTCGDGRVLEVRRLQREGRNAMSAKDFLRGFPLTGQAVSPAE